METIRSDPEYGSGHGTLVGTSASSASRSASTAGIKGCSASCPIYTDMGQAEAWGFSMADYLALEEQQTSFDGVGMFRSGTVTFNHDETAERVPVRIVTPNLFSLLGIAPLHGRSFTESDADQSLNSVNTVALDFHKAQRPALYITCEHGDRIVKEA